MNKLYSFIKNNKFLLLLVLLTSAFYYKLLIHPAQAFYPAFDLYYSSYIEKTLITDSIKFYKTLPLWNPYVFSGSPFLGNPPSAMFYPLNIFFLFLPVISVFNYMFLLNSFLIGLFTYLYAQTIKLSRFASLVSAITMMFSGPVVTTAFEGHPINSNTIVWLPLALLLLELMIQRRKLILSILTGFIISVIIFAGAPQIASYEILFLAMYILFRAFILKKHIKVKLKILALFILSISIGTLISSVQLLPTAEFVRLSQRGAGISYNFASDFSLHPYQTLSFVLPNFFGSPANNTWWGKGTYAPHGYIGFLPIFFVPFVIFFRKNRYALIFFALGIFSLFYSFGKYGPIFPFFYYYVPGFSHFREPTRFLFIYAFCFSMLSGIGADFFIKKVKSNFFLLLSILLFTLLTVFYLKPNVNNVKLYEKYVLRNSFAVGINHTTLYSQTRSEILFALILLLLFYISMFLKNKKIMNINYFKAILILLIFFDLWFFGYKIIKTKKLNEIYSSNPLINTILKDKGTYRVFDMEGAFIPLLGKNKIESITGVAPLYLKDYQTFLWTLGDHMDASYDSFFVINDISNPIILSLLNVKYVITNKPIDVSRFLEVMRSDSSVGSTSVTNNIHYLYKNLDVLPRAHLVSNVISTNNKQEMLEALKDNFDAKKYIILEKQPKNLQNNNSSKFSEISIIKSNPNELNLKVNLTSPAFLVLSEIYYPGWTAYDNEKKIEILNANFLFRSLYLQSGKHNIAFAYNPASFKIGAALSTTTVFLSLLYLIIYIKKSREHLNS